MGSVGINFGSATSGSGFDVTSTVNSIMALERTPETAWATQTATLQAQDTVLTLLGTNISSLSTALAALTSFDGVFAQMDGASSDPNTVALTSVGATAQAGTHTLTVKSLATTAHRYSSAVSATTKLSGSLLLQKAGAATSTTISIAANSSLSDVATAINKSTAGVTATVLFDSSGQYLSLTSGQSGAAGDLTVTSNAQDSSGNIVSFTSTQAGRDAQYTLDGVSLTSGSNTITGALQGVSFQLTGTSTAGILLQVAPDQSGIATALQSFVSAYNTLTTSLAAQEGKDPAGNAQPLYGSTVISEIQSSLSSAFAYQPSGSGKGLSLASLGLSLSTTGTLSLDTATLGATLATDYSGASESFLTAGSFGQNLATALNGVGSTGTGTIASALRDNSSAEATLADNKARLETRLSIESADLTKELALANQILQAIPRQLDEINQIFYAINGYKNS